MATVICNHTVGCPYRNEKGFCEKQYVIIDENAHCSARWRKGQATDAYDLGDLPREKIVEMEV